MKLELLANASAAYVIAHLFVIVLLFCVLLSEAIIQVYLRNLRMKFVAEQKDLTDEVLIEKASIEYYRNKQAATMTRTFIYSVAILLGLLYYDVRAFSFFAIALGAIIMTIKETIISFFSYFHILQNYHIGDDLRVNGVRGEILNIRPTQTTLLGKEDDGEYNGKVTIVPNYHFTLQSVEKQEMKSHSYLMASVSIPFNTDGYKLSFKEFVNELKTFLDSMLPSRGMNTVGYYRSYSGVRYKINYTYDKDARVMIHVTFVSKPRRISDRKEKIIAFVESKKK